GGLAADVAADVAQRYAAVARGELRGAAEVLDRDPAVDGVDRHHRVARHLHFEADVPVIVTGARRPVGAQRGRGRVDANAGGHASGVGLRVGVAGNPRAHVDVVAIPADDFHAAVAAGVDVERVAARDRRLAHFAVAIALVVTAVTAPVVGRAAGSARLR